MSPQLPRPWTEHSHETLIHHASRQDCSLPIGLGFTAFGKWSITFSKSIRIRARPKFFSRPRASAPKIFASVTASFSPRPAITIPRALRNESRCSIWSRMGESSWDRVIGSFRGGRIHLAPTLKRRCGARNSQSPRFTREPFTGLEGKYFEMPPRNVVPKPVQKPHPPLWVACSRHETIHSPPKTESARWFQVGLHQSGRGGPLGDRLSQDARRAMRSDWRRDQSRSRVRDADDGSSRRTRSDPARHSRGGNFFGYSLGHFYIFGDHKPGRTDVWSELRKAARRARLLARRGDRDASAAARRSPRRLRRQPAGNPRRRRHSRAVARVPAPLRGSRRRSR